MSVFQRGELRRRRWAKTRWSMVSGLGARDEPQWQTAWSDLVETYRKPMEGYVRSVLWRTRRRSASDEEAEEIVQGFLARCVEKEWLSRADRERGRFRAYIQTLLQRYTYRTIRHAMAQRRYPGPGRVLPILDGEVEDERSPEERAAFAEFDRSWVEVARDRALERLAERNARYHAVVLDLITTHGEGSPDIGERLGVRREQMAVLRHRARARFAEFLVEELANTVDDEEAYEEELRALEPYLP